VVGGGGSGRTVRDDREVQDVGDWIIQQTSTQMYNVGYFTTKEQAARAYDAEVRRRGWTHLKRLNFSDPAADAALPTSSAAAGEAPGPE